MLTLTSVSYTHLDVYKRQVLELSPLQVNVPKNPEFFSAALILILFTLSTDCTNA